MKRGWAAALWGLVLAVMLCVPAQVHHLRLYILLIWILTPRKGHSRKKTAGNRSR